MSFFLSFFPTFCSFLIAIITLQGPTVEGKVSITCDAWQAGNTDGYFAVTAHWIEESTTAKWELKSALIWFHAAQQWRTSWSGSIQGHQTSQN